LIAWYISGLRIPAASSASLLPKREVPDKGQIRDVVAEQTSCRKGKREFSPG